MKLGQVLLASAFLVANLGCEKRLEPEQQDFVPTEAGLTLIFENPSLPEGERSEKRMQVRLDKVLPREGGLELHLTYTSLQGRQQQTLFSRKGSYAPLVDNKTLTTLLPENFFHGSPKWEDKTIAGRILGRASWPYASKVLPPGYPSVGVWVEYRANSPGFPALRAFYLPGIGEAETMELSKNRWICFNRLVSRGFTEDPQAKPKE